MHALVGRAMPPGVERWPVGDEAAWHARRQADMTASVAGALLGVHEFVSYYDLWCLKAGLIERSAEDSPAMRRGRLLEDDAIQVLGEDHEGWRVAPCGFYYRHPSWRIGATPDAVAIDPLRKGFGAVQIKSVEPSIFRSKWQGEDGIEPPLWITVQAIIEATLMGASWAAVAPIVVGHGVDVPLIEIPVHAGIMDKLRAETAVFWASVEEGNAPEPDFRTDAATIAGLHPEDNGQEIDLTGSNDLPELADELAVIRARGKADEARAAEIKARFRYEIGAAEAALLGGGRRVTLRTISRPGFWVEPTTFRVLRFGSTRS